MDWLKFESISFLPDSSIGQLCEDLNEIVGKWIYYDRFEIHNTKCCGSLVICFAALNNDEILCGCFGMYPSFVAGILNTARRIHFFVFCNEELNYENYIEKCIGGKYCSVCYKSDIGHFFQISYQGESVFITFEARLFPKLPSELMFAPNVLTKYSWVVWFTAQKQLKAEWHA